MASMYKMGSEVCLLRGKSGDKLLEDTSHDTVILITVKTAIY